MKNIAVIGLFQKTLLEEKQKAFKPATGPTGVLRPLKYVPEKSMERLSVSECISKCWTTLIKQSWLEGLQTVGSLSK